MTLIGTERERARERLPLIALFCIRSLLSDLRVFQLRILESNSFFSLFSRDCSETCGLFLRYSKFISIIWSLLRLLKADKSQDAADSCNCKSPSPSVALSLSLCLSLIVRSIDLWIRANHSTEAFGIPSRDLYFCTLGVCVGPRLQLEKMQLFASWSHLSRWRVRREVGGGRWCEGSQGPALALALAHVWCVCAV